MEKNGFRINAIGAFDYSGVSVSGAGDINGDTFDDVIVGATYAPRPDGKVTGQGYVIFGKGDGFDADVELAGLDGSSGFTINGVNRYDYLGASVSSAGDFNGDGIDDIIIGAPQAKIFNGLDTGQSYVIFGKADTFVSSLDVTDLNGTNGFVIDGDQIGGSLGSSISSAGDINGDGINDVIVGAAKASRSYVIFGDSSLGSKANLSVKNLDGSNGFVIEGARYTDGLGVSVSGAGDFNGDGIDDIIVGAPSANSKSITNVGEGYVIFGRSGGFDASLDLEILEDTEGIVFQGSEYQDHLGRSVSSIGDFNDDGVDDIIIGATRSNSFSFGGAGEAYVVFGRSDIELGDSDLVASFDSGTH
jgi:hypothetical protein